MTSNAKKHRSILPISTPFSVPTFESAYEEKAQPCTRLNSQLDGRGVHDLRWLEASLRNLTTPA